MTRARTRQRDVPSWSAAPRRPLARPPWAASAPTRSPTTQARLIDKVTAASTTSATLSDVKHVVILMQENRSFDHYFGTLSGVRGFSDPNVPQNSERHADLRPVRLPAGHRASSAAGYMQPFRLLNNPPSENGEDTNDIDHSWAAQHDSWNGGKLDSFINLAPGDRRQRQRPGHHGLLHPQRARLLLRARRRVHDLRRLPLLGARPDRPEPADGHVGLDRPGGQPRRPGDHHRVRPARP